MKVTWQQISYGDNSLKQLASQTWEKERVPYKSEFLLLDLWAILCWNLIECELSPEQNKGDYHQVEFGGGLAGAGWHQAFILKPFSICTEVGLKAFKKTNKQKSPLAFQSIPNGFFRSPGKGAIGLHGQDDPITNLSGTHRLCTVPGRQQVPIKYSSVKWISSPSTVIHLALTNLSDYSLCLSQSNVQRGCKKTSLRWGWRRGDLESGNSSGGREERRVLGNEGQLQGLGQLPGEETTRQGGDSKDKGVCLGTSEGTCGGGALPSGEQWIPAPHSDAALLLPPPPSLQGKQTVFVRYAQDCNTQTDWHKFMPAFLV